MRRPQLRRRSANVLLALLCAACLWLPSRSAAAQDAEKLFATAQALFEQKQCEAALPLFRKLHDQTSSPNARLYIARCYRQQGEILEAYLEMRGTLAEATARAADEERYEPTRLAADTELKQLRAQIAELRITLHASLAGATVTVAGRKLSPEALTGPVPVAAGNVEVTATAVGGRVVQLVVAPAGSSQDVVLRVTPDVVKPASAPQPNPITDDGGLAGVQVGGLVVMGLGLGALGGFAATTLLADARFATLEDECGAVRCEDAAFAEVVDEGKTFETTSYVLLGTSLALIVGGTLMLALGGDGADDDSSDDLSASLMVLPLPGGAAFSGALTF